MRLRPSAATHHPDAGRQRERIPAVPPEPRTLRGKGRPLRKIKVSAAPTGKAEKQLPAGAALRPLERWGDAAEQGGPLLPGSAPIHHAPAGPTGARPGESLHLPVGLSPETLVQNNSSSSRHPKHRPDKVAGMVPPAVLPASAPIRTPRAAPPEEASSGPEWLCRRASYSSNDGGPNAKQSCPKFTGRKKQEAKITAEETPGPRPFPSAGMRSGLS